MGPASHFTVVTLPAYKAEGTLERTVGALPAGTADHLLLVDDASPDGTVDLARRLGIDGRVHDRNRGYGGNQKTCYREALDLGATVIVLLHPDYQYDPSAVPALVAPIVAGVADFTFGSRFACTGDPRAGGDLIAHPAHRLRRVEALRRGLAAVAGDTAGRHERRHQAPHRGCPAWKVTDTDRVTTSCANLRSR